MVYRDWYHCMVHMVSIIRKVEITMVEKKTSEAQLKASRKWQEKNKEHMNYIRKRSAARGFIKVATQEDLNELKQLIAERENNTVNN